MRQDVVYVWHKESRLPECDVVVLPGGFSYGDYLRTGCIARFSPIMSDVMHHARTGRLVIGICNGFQVLLEAGMLPGAMMLNRTLLFVCRHLYLRVENNATLFTRNMVRGSVLDIPVAHGEGNYYCDADTLKKLQDRK